MLRFMLFFTVLNFIISRLKFSFSLYFPLSFFFIILCLLLWFKDIIRERITGIHTHKLELRLRAGMLLFILSEIFFFFSFFWCFLDRAVSPTIEYGLIWPPKRIVSISFYSVPLLNTIILLTRGVTITWAHHSLVRNDFNNTVLSMAITILLGIFFIYVQIEEYIFSSFSIADGVYGSIFYMATGFHGLHVMGGTCFLFYVLVRVLKNILRFNHHFSFEARAWYWHFVDVVWLFLYLVVYVWFS